jgi:ribosome-binding ATPase
MGFNLGLVGLPNSGKSTLFNALVGSGAQVANYPFTTIDPNIGIVVIPDARVDSICAISRSAKTTPTAIEVVDIAGLVKGAHTGEGLGNRFLSHIRSVDAIYHVVRCFEGASVPHTMGRLDAEDDAQIVDLELIMADLDMVERRIERTAKSVKGGEPLEIELAALEKSKKALDRGTPIRLAGLTEPEVMAMAGLTPLTLKPCVYVANVSETHASRPDDAPGYDSLKKYAAGQGGTVAYVSAKIEAELADLTADEAELFATELGMGERGTDRLVSAGYSTLNLITFITTNENETRAWTVRRGSRAQEAAGKIHSQMEAGFIRAEVTPASDLIKAGSFSASRSLGYTRLEGKDYVVRDGDVMFIRFSPA